MTIRIELLESLVSGFLQRARVKELRGC